MIALNGYKVCESMVETPQFNLLRVQDSLHHEKFIAKVYSHPSDQQVQSLKNMVQLVKEEEWEDALKPVKLLLQQDAATIIFKNTEGCTLRQFIQQHKKIRSSEFVPAAFGLCEMLAAFRSSGWIIGNLRPEHIFIDPQNKSCKIVDFRKASRVFKRETEKEYIFSGPDELAYISPEQTGRTNQIIDYRSDYYSLGIIFYEMLAGRLPFESQSSSELLYAHIARKPDAVSAINPYVPRILNDIVMKLLLKNPEDRYQSISGLMDDLQNSTGYFQDQHYLDHYKLGQTDYVNRITISSKLVGRDDELAVMNDAYRLALQGNKQTLYIGGYSGVGKSRLVQEFYIKRAEASSFISKAKFDSLQRNLPYSALIMAIKEVIGYILREDELRVKYWQERLLKFLNDNGQIIINAVPELEIVIGKQPPPAELPPDESQIRFQQTFLNFIAALSSGDHSLIIFLDDLQWADLASIKLIELMVLDNGISNFMFIGAYRDNEVDPTHTLAISLRRLKKKADIKEIKLPPLKKASVAFFILETLRRQVEQSDDLIEMIFKKTQGNIFFIIQLLTSLNEAGLLYNGEKGMWKWDKKALQEYNFSENVIDLLVQKINTLDDTKKNILRTGACIGDTFDLYVLSHLLTERLYTLANELSEVINIGYVFTQDENLDHYIRSSQNVNEAELHKFGNVHFRFSHDRIRQACLSLVNEEDLAFINFKAGQFKLKNYNPTEVEKEIFFIANHLNKGRQFIKEKEDIESFVDVSLKAGKKARETNAYDSAIDYCNQGRQFLNFKDNYEQLYNFYLLGAACEYQVGRYDEAEHDLNELYNNSQTRINKLDVLMLKVFMYTSKDEKEKAVESGRIGFHLFGLYMPKTKPIILMVVFKDVLKTRWVLRGKRISTLSKKAGIKDSEKNRFLEFIHGVSPAIYQYDQNLFAWDVMKMVDYSLKYGNSGVASFGYMGYGMILAQLFGFYKLDHQLSEVAISITQQLGYGGWKWKLLMSYHNFVQHWTRPVRPEFDHMQEIINGCTANGDIIYAGYGIFHFHQKKFALGFPLEDLQQSLENYLHAVDQKKDKETRRFLEGYYYAVRCLRGEDDNILLMGDSFNVVEKLREIIASSSFSVAADTYIAYIDILYQFRYYQEAWNRYLEGGRYMTFIYHRYEYAEYNFYGGLICAIAYEKKLSPPKHYLKLLKKHLKMLKKWNSYCPDNFEPQYLLLQAELSRATGNTAKAAAFYEKAIQSADKYLFINIKALACELAGRYHFSSGNTIMAKTYLDNARQAYKQWGALLKVKYIEKEFKNLFGKSILEDVNGNANKGALQNVEMNVVLQASHAIDNEEDIDKIIEQLMQAVIQNSGADHGYLLIKNRADLVIKALYNPYEGAKPVTEYPSVNTLPLNTVRYVGRVKEPLIINNPAKQAEYSELPYFTTHKPFSVLIFPILKQGELFGILYLENYLTAGVFDTHRIELLNLISTQIAMILDNAYLYQNMESMVNERTVSLKTERDQITELLENILPKEAIQELKLTGKATPQKLENITVMIADIRGFTKISEKLSPEELIKMIDHYFRAFDEITGKYGLEKIKTIGDAYMAIGGVGKTLVNGAEKMVQAALEMQEFTKKHIHDLESGKQVELLIGIHTGIVIAGVVGTIKLQYDIWGDTVNVAARMQQNSAPFKVNISEVTAEQVKNKFHLIYRGKITAKNKGDMDMYFVEPL